MDGKRIWGRGSRGKARVKRKEVQSADGWTVITHGLSSMSLNHQDAGSLPSQVVEGLTAEKLQEDLNKLQECWEDTILAKQVEGILGEREWGVKEAVCIGIGSFSRDWAHRWRSLWQLVLFIGVVERLRKLAPGVDIKPYAQDPAFTTLDIGLLKLVNIQVLTSDLESKITEKSFIYSPFVDWFLLLPTFLKNKSPVLYVGNEILDDYSPYAQTSEKKDKLHECNEIGKQWLDGREMVKFEEFEMHANALNGMVVYWRKTGDNEVGEDKKNEEADGHEERRHGEQAGRSEKKANEGEKEEGSK